MAQNDIYSLAKILGAKNLSDSPFAKSAAGLNYLSQNDRYENTQQFLDNAQTAAGSLTGGIAYYLEAKNRKKALDQLGSEIEAKTIKDEERRSTLANLFPEDQRGIAQTLDMETLTKAAADRLKPTDPDAALDREYKRAQIDKLRREGRGSGGYSPKVADAIDTDILKKSTEQSNLAAGSLVKLDQLAEVLNRNKTGKGYAFAQAAGQYVPFVDSKDYQTATQASNELGLETSALLKGQTSDRDVSRSILANPSYQYEKAANDQIIKNKKIALQIKRDVAGFNNRWISENGSTLNPNGNGEDYNSALVKWEGKKFDELGGVRQKENEATSSTSYKGHNVIIKNKPNQ